MSQRDSLQHYCAPENAIYHVSSKSSNMSKNQSRDWLPFSGTHPMYCASHVHVYHAHFVWNHFVSRFHTAHWSRGSCKTKSNILYCVRLRLYNNCLAFNCCTSRDHTRAIHYGSVWWENIRKYASLSGNIGTFMEQTCLTHALSTPSRLLCHLLVAKVLVVTWPFLSKDAVMMSKVPVLSGKFDS